MSDVDLNAHHEQMNCAFNTPPIKEIPVRAEAIEVVSAIFEAFKVSNFTYTTYSPHLTDYPLDINQLFNWEKWIGSKGFKELSNKVVQSTTETGFIGDDEADIFDIVALGSKVQMTDGRLGQLRMLDFRLNIDGVITLDDILNFGFPKGWIVTSGAESDGRYHYYSKDILSDREWQYWIKGLIDKPGSDELFGREYLRFCLLRGYSALRLFAYEDTPKNIIPKVLKSIG